MKRGSSRLPAVVQLVEINYTFLVKVLQRYEIFVVVLFVHVLDVLDVESAETQCLVQFKEQEEFVVEGLGGLLIRFADQPS